jgi:hypothetical protein
MTRKRLFAVHDDFTDALLVGVRIGHLQATVALVLSPYDSDQPGGEGLLTTLTFREVQEFSITNGFTGDQLAELPSLGTDLNEISGVWEEIESDRLEPYGSEFGAGVFRHFVVGWEISPRRRVDIVSRHVDLTMPGPGPGE